MLDLENKDLSGSFNQRIAALNQMINQAFEELLDELQDFHRPDRVSDSLQLEAVEQIKDQLKLMNARSEEVLGTSITLEEIEDESCS